MTQLYDAERLQKIGEIMPRFCQHVQEGDEIAFGLEGDPLFPAEYKEERPVGIVTKVKSAGDAATLRVQMKNGSVIDIPPHSVDPQRVWEFTDDTFQQVLKRSIEKNMPSEDPDYRGVESDANDIQNLREELRNMKESFAHEIQESKNFNNTLIATLHEITTDVCRNNPNESSGFCSVFSEEYKKMMNSEYKGSSPFESDFSDSDSSSDE
tara:strand:- start:21 stop:650 length:630 start_codon:yes stop_codon:yes gene_type:complete